MKRLLLALALAALAGCIVERTVHDTDTRKAPTEERANEGDLLPGPPHPNDPCTPDCRHYTFGGNWVKSHRHSQGCGHYYDEYLKYWMVP